ncbi:HutD/Ves family protein [Paraburkholderia acidisoli]|uniref:HutD family protein n=1 Tax=Paraburkholderia acidisoli TaxID=2571748 RepID=A0A7Z2JFR2_9BURK|nr:HutD family protein [Paraburkholderia acidisoli]QGZ63006.1 HutD family protein [Paraburkholderia acidisoli]
MNDAHAAVKATLTVLRGADLVASPWKNGGGVTREIAAGSSTSAGSASLDTFAWRVSVADVAQAGPFSRFAGVDRTLVLLEGAGMLLHEARDESGDAEKTYALETPLDIARFRGEASISARLIDGPTRDFNLMVRREAARGTLDVWRDNATRSVQAQTVLLYCAQGEQRIRVDGELEVQLATGDTLRIDAPVATLASTLETRGAGALLAIALTLIPTDSQR